VLRGLQVRRRRAETVLTVDDQRDSGTVFGHSFQFGRGAGNSDVFVGGMPPELVANLSLMAMPSAVFAARLRGSVRNMVCLLTLNDISFSWSLSLLQNSDPCNSV